MPELLRRRSTASDDQLFELVEGLDDTQIYTLLQDLNNTVTSNIPVSRGIDLFEHPKPKKTPAREPSIRRSNFALPKLFTRSASRRISSAPAPISRPKTGIPTAPRHYRRISRPILPSTSSNPDSNALLSAYLARSPTRSDSNAPSPHSIRSHWSSSIVSFEAEDAGIDTLAPLVFGRPQRETSEMGDIFEVLGFRKDQ